MSLTDVPTQKGLEDVYPLGTPFVIQSAWVEGVVPTTYGQRTMAKVLVTPVGGGNPEEFAVWGSLCEQVQQLEEGDTPGTYKVVQDGKRKLFADAAADAAGLGEAPAPPAAEGAPAAAAPVPPVPPAPEQEAPTS